MTEKQIALLKLTKFLKDNECYDTFIHEIIGQDKVSLEELFNSLNDYYDFINIIDHALIWTYTNDGHDYWEELNNRFINEYSSILYECAEDKSIWEEDQ